MKGINKKKWIARLKEMLDDPDYEEPGGLMACSPEIYAEMQKSMEKEISEAHPNIDKNTLDEDEQDPNEDG